MHVDIFVVSRMNDRTTRIVEVADHLLHSKSTRDASKEQLCPSLQSVRNAAAIAVGKEHLESR